jgi:hypothetical protein
MSVVSHRPVSSPARDGGVVWLGLGQLPSTGIIQPHSDGSCLCPLMERAAAYAGTLQEHNVESTVPLKNNRGPYRDPDFSSSRLFGPSWGARRCASHGDVRTYLSM